MDLLNVYMCIRFGRYLEGNPALHKTELQTRVTHNLVLHRKSMKCLLFLIFFPICQVKSKPKLLHALETFSNFSFVCLHWTITWHLGKVKMKVKTDRVSNWITAQSRVWGSQVSTSLPCLLPKMTDKLLL